MLKQRDIHWTGSLPRVRERNCKHVLDAALHWRIKWKHALFWQIQSSGYRAFSSELIMWSKHTLHEATEPWTCYSTPVPRATKFCHAKRPSKLCSSGYLGKIMNYHIQSATDVKKTLIGARLGVLFSPNTAEILNANYYCSKRGKTPNSYFELLQFNP